MGTVFPGVRHLALSPYSGRLIRPGESVLRVVEACEQVIARLIGGGCADMANMQLLDSADRSLWIVAQDGFRAEFLEFFEVVRGEDSACGAALARARPVWVPDVARSPVFAGTPAGDVVLGAGVYSVASVPVLGNDHDLISP